MMMTWQRRCKCFPVKSLNIYYSWYIWFKCVCLCCSPIEPILFTFSLDLAARRDCQSTLSPSSRRQHLRLVVLTPVRGFTANYLLTTYDETSSWVKHTRNAKSTSTLLCAIAECVWWIVIPTWWSIYVSRLYGGGIFEPKADWNLRNKGNESGKKDLCSTNLQISRGNNVGFVIRNASIPTQGCLKISRLTLNVYWNYQSYFKNII